MHYGSNAGPGLLLHEYTQCCWLQLHVPALGEHGACISAPTDTASVRYPNTSALGTEGGRNTSVFCVSPAEGSPWLGQPTRPPVTAGDVCLSFWERCSVLPPAQPAKKKAAAMSQPGQGLGLGGLLRPYQPKTFYDIFYRKKKKEMGEENGKRIILCLLGERGSHRVQRAKYTWKAKHRSICVMPAIFLSFSEKGAV